MDSIDINNRKPRRIKGTPVVKIRFYAAAAAIVYTVITGTLYMISPLNRELRETTELLCQARKQEELETTNEEKNKRYLMMAAYRHARQIQISDFNDKASGEEGQ